MGTWGTGLYQSDFARDLKADLAEWLGVPMTPEEIVAGLGAEKGLGTHLDTADECAFWLVMADQLHRHGLDVAEVTRRARAIIDDGTDIAAQADLGLNETDQQKRATALEALRDKWATPAARPARRRILKPEPQLLKTGDLFTYPVMDGNPQRKPLGQHDIATYSFTPDAANAFVVLAEARLFHDLFALAFVAPLAIFSERSGIAAEDCLEASFLCEVSYFYRTFKPVGGWVWWNAKRLKLIGAERIGTTELDAGAVRATFGEALTPPRSRFAVSVDPLFVNVGFQSSIARGSIWGDHDHVLASHLVRTAVL